jgi:predicted PurR-regulated permease PerM/methylmalonyl-CoA mutase cobalamin-binding subunit
MSAAGTVGRAEPIRLKFATAAVAATAIVALYIARPVLVPLSLAILIAFALAPIAGMLRKFKIGPIAAVAATVALAFAVVASLALFLGGQFTELAATVTPHAASTPVNEPLPLWVATTLAGPLLHPLTSAGVAVLFAAFLLLNRERLAAKFADAAEAGSAFGRHLLGQGLLDLGFGVTVAAGLWAVGVPNFGLWALLGVMLRSVPVIGVPVAAVCPLMLTTALEPALVLLCKTLVLFLGANAAVLSVERRYVPRPVARLSVLAAIGATMVWTCLWGLTGLLLAMPLTLGAVLLGRRFEAFGFLDRLLADAPLKDAPPEKSEPVLQALATAQRQLGGHAVDAGKLAIRLAPAVLADAQTQAQLFAAHWRRDPVLCVAGPGMMDQAAAALLAEALRRKGLRSRVVAFAQTEAANLPRLDLRDVQAVCVSCLDAGDAAAVRKLVRRLRPRLRHAHMIAGLWGWSGEALMNTGSAECDLVTTNLSEAAERILRLARASSDTEAPPVEYAPESHPAAEPEIATVLAA